MRTLVSTMAQGGHTAAARCEVASTLPAGRLYVSGHAGRRGYAVERYWSDAECLAAGPSLLEAVECAPRFVQERKRAFALVERWNRRFASFDRLDDGSQISRDRIARKRV